MAYIDKTYILSRASETDITDILGNGGAINDTKLNNIIDDASAVVDGKLNIRYNTPITPVPDDLKRIVLDIVLYFIYSINHTNEEMENLYNRYKIALKTLDSIAKGDQDLKGVSLKSTISSAIIVAKSRKKIYTDEYLGMM